MLANVLALSLLETRSQPADALTVPKFSDGLLEAERTHAELAAELEAARGDCAKLQANFNVLGLKRANGEPFPYPGDARYAALAELTFKVTDLEKAKEQARINLANARRSFEQQAYEHLRPTIDQTCERVIEHLAQAEAMLDTLHNLTIDAREMGLALKQGPLGRAQYLATQLRNMQHSIAPVPTMGVRR